MWLKDKQPTLSRRRFLELSGGVFVGQILPPEQVKEAAPKNFDTELKEIKYWTALYSEILEILQQDIANESVPPYYVAVKKRVTELQASGYAAISAISLYQVRLKQGEVLNGDIKKFRADAETKINKALAGIELFKQESSVQGSPLHRFMHMFIGSLQA